MPGYPYNLDFDYGALSQLQQYSINNLGDPFIESNYGVHSRQFEVSVASLLLQAQASCLLPCRAIWHAFVHVPSHFEDAQTATC
jgi:hypothetical protein